MPGTPTQFGPFDGGLNTLNDSSSIADNELMVCQNFEIDGDGSLKSRPPIQNIGPDFPLDTIGDIQPLGWWQKNPTTNLLIVSDNKSSTYAWTGSAWQLITNTMAATAMQAWNGYLWLLASNTSGQLGGRWDGTTYTAEPNMPKGVSIVLYKERLLIGSGANHTSGDPTRMWLSNTVDLAPTYWPVSPLSIFVSNKDGQAIVRLVPWNGGVLVFRTNSIWLYSFNSDPAAAQRAPVVPTVGLSSPYALDIVEGAIYFIWDQRAWVFLNNQANQLNPKVPLLATARSGYRNPTVSNFNRRIFFCYYDTAYVFNLQSRTWSTWTSPVYGGIGQVIPTVADANTYATAYVIPSKLVPTGSGRVVNWLSITDTFAGVSEAYTCIFQTKNFDNGLPGQFKRMFFAGVDTVYRDTLVSKIQPIAYHSTVSWGQVVGRTWSDVELYTWDQVGLSNSAIVTTRVAAGNQPLRKFLKLGQSFRYRQVNFRMEFSTTGTALSGPVRVFGITAVVGAKEHVVAAIS